MAKQVSFAKRGKYEQPSGVVALLESNSKRTPRDPAVGCVRPPLGGATPHPALRVRKRVGQVDQKAEGFKERRKPSVSSLLEAAAAMPAKERKELLDRLALESQLSAKAAQNRDLDMWSAAVSESLERAIGAAGGENYGQALVKRSLAAPAYWRPIESFMASSGLQELGVVERLPVYRLLADLLVDHAGEVSRRSGAPLSVKLLGNCSSNIAAVFDQAFPGYVAAGLAKVVARQLHAVA